MTTFDLWEEDEETQQESEATEHEEFVIDTPDKADWAIKKVKEERQRRDLFVSVAEHEITELQKKVRACEDKCAAKNAFLTDKLDVYFDQLPAKTTKTKASVSLPSGKLVRKLSTLEMAKEESELIAYLQVNAPEYITEKPLPRWGEFKKLLCIQEGAAFRTDTGELLEFIHVVEKPGSFDIE